MNIRTMVSVFGILTALVLFSVSVQAELPAPKAWLAAVGETGGNAAIDNILLNSAPSFVLYPDGTAIWPDAAKLYAWDHAALDTWRVGKVPPKAIEQFQAAAQVNKFFTVQPAPVVASPDTGGAVRVGMAVSDGTTTHVAVQFGGRKRAVAIYALGIYAAQAAPGDTYLSTIAATHAEILALKPAQSKPYLPDSIRVGVFPTFTTTVGIAWPLAETLTPTEVPHWRNYSGAQAKSVIQTLAQSAFITSGGHLYHVVWAPDIDIPKPTSDTEK